MQELHLNLWVVLAAAVVKFLLGGLWYSAIFQKPWMKEMGFKPKDMKKGMGARSMAIEFVGNLLMAFVLAHAIRYAGVHGPVDGLCVAFFNWLGFVAVVQIHSVIFEMKSWRLFFINAGFQFTGMLLMGVILALWV
ncbi:MAG TPA: DUF1761 domain-containing protein [bacterium]|nr:DUF1761 domain-containing protein [bacterium]